LLKLNAINSGTSSKMSQHEMLTKLAQMPYQNNPLYNQGRPLSKGHSEFSSTHQMHSGY
jgi:hypothetical protein